MRKIREVIVVEGKNDAIHLKSFFDCDTIITDGRHLKKATIDMIKEANTKRGVIVLVDPDRPGEYIRDKLNSAIPGLKNAFLQKKDARTTKKVGVEHASYEVIKEALDNLVTYTDEKGSLTSQDLMDLGVIGDGALRAHIAERLHLGHPNNKTLLKRLNMLGVDRDRLKEVIDGRDNSQSKCN